MFRNRWAFRVLVVLIGLVVSGENACREDYVFAPDAQMTSSTTPTPTPTPDEDDDDLITPTPTPTDESSPSPSASPSASPSPSPSASETTSALFGFKTEQGKAVMDSLQELSAVSSQVGVGEKAAQRTSEGDWLGKIYTDEEIDGAALDSDGDGYSDNLENDVNSDAFDPSSIPPPPVTLLANRMVGRDNDVDGLSNEEEERIGTNPQSGDSDQDGFGDGAEVRSGTDPLSGQDRPVDTDGDGLSNHFEASFGINPHSSDSDDDKLRDDLELAIGSDPLDNDTDRDGIFDGKEVELGSDPIIAESN